MREIERFLMGEDMRERADIRIFHSPSLHPFVPFFSHHILTDTFPAYQLGQGEDVSKPLFYLCEEAWCSFIFFPSLSLPRLSSKAVRPCLITTFRLAGTQYGIWE